MSMRKFYGIMQDGYHRLKDRIWNPNRESFHHVMQYRESFHHVMQHRESFHHVMQELKLVDTRLQTVADENMKPSKVVLFFHDSNHYKSFDRVIKELRIAQGIHNGNDNMRPSEVLSFFKNFNREENDNHSVAVTEEFSDFEIVTEEEAKQYLYQVALNLNFNRRNFSDEGVSGNYYYDEVGCPFDSYNLANWDGDQQVGFRE